MVLLLEEIRLQLKLQLLHLEVVKEEKLAERAEYLGKIFRDEMRKIDTPDD